MFLTMNLDTRSKGTCQINVDDAIVASNRFLLGCVGLDKVTCAAAPHPHPRCSKPVAADLLRRV